MPPDLTSKTPRQYVLYEDGSRYIKGQKTKSSKSGEALWMVSSPNASPLKRSSYDALKASGARPKASKLSTGGNSISKLVARTRPKLAPVSKRAPTSEGLSGKASLLPGYRPKGGGGTTKQ